MRYTDISVRTHAVHTNTINFKVIKTQFTQLLIKNVTVTKDLLLYHCIILTEMEYNRDTVWSAVFTIYC